MNKFLEAPANPVMQSPKVALHQSTACSLDEWGTCGCAAAAADVLLAGAAGVGCRLGLPGGLSAATAGEGLALGMGNLRAGNEKGALLV